jgi:predicted dehydrogenase
MTAPVRLAVVGGGWRAEFFTRLAGLLPDRFTLVGAAARTPETVERLGREWGVPSYGSAAELVDAQHPELVVSSVPRSENPHVLADLVGRGVHVLTETPPASDEAALAALWSELGARDLVHVAEQYPSMPTHAARQEVVRRGHIGRPTSVQVSSTHDYHAVALMRRHLGVGLGPTRVSATSFTAPLVDPLRRSGWTDDPEPKQAATVLATIDFGDGASGLYDFTDNQWHNRLRRRRLVVRGSSGEIVDDTVVGLVAERTVVTATIVRSQLGHDLNLDGADTEHLSLGMEVLWRNPFLGLRLMDEEIAIASVMVAAAGWARDEGPGPYSLADACHDHLVSLAVHRSLATGAPVDTPVPPWAR